MIEEIAVVVETDGDKALLEIVRSKPCGLCGQTRGCGLSLWGGLLGHRNRVFHASNEIGARTGDSVVVGIDEKALLAGSLAAYGVPLLFLIAGAAMGGALLPAAMHADARSGAGAVVGLVLGLLWLKGHTTGRGPQSGCRPRILRPAASCASGRNVIEVNK